MSPLQLQHQAWTFALQGLSAQLDAMSSLRVALPYMWEYHELTGFVDDNPSDLEPVRFEKPGGRMSLLALDIPRRARRYQPGKNRNRAGGPAPAFGGHPLARENIFEQQAGKQFFYLRPINGNLYHFLPQVQPFGREHFTIATASQEPQDWRPSLTALHRLLLDMHAIAALLGKLVLFNGTGAGAGLPDWRHLHSLCPPGAGPMPVQQAFALAGLAAGPVTRLGEPHWPLPAFRVAGPAEAIAGEVLKLARRSEALAGPHATESIAMFPEEGAVVCVYVPRDRRRERVEAFGASLGAFETATGSLVFSGPEKCAELRAGRIGFDELWKMLRGVRPGWSDEL